MFCCHYILTALPAILLPERLAGEKRENEK
jgi:hypothetical protein